MIFFSLRTFFISVKTTKELYICAKIQLLSVRIFMAEKKNIGGSSTKGVEMSFLQHLEELRWHLVRASAAVIVCGVFIFLNKQFIFDHVILAPKSPDFVTNRFLVGWPCSLIHRI